MAYPRGGGHRVSGIINQGGGSKESLKIRELGPGTSEID